MSDTETFEGWAIVELMGHRKLAGHVTEQEIAGSAFLRLDIHGLEGPAVTTQPGTSWRHPSPHSP